VLRVIVNTGQAEAWNGYEGRHWADHQDRYDAVNSGFNDYLLAAAVIEERDRVLDIGCGNGQVTRLAARLAHHGHVLGLDLSAPMRARAQASAADEGIANVTVDLGDAQVYPFTDGAFDLAISRFGIMFFADPVAAFGNIARALRPGGRLAFLCLPDPGGTDLGTVLAAMAEHLPVPAAAEPGGAGPLSLADPAVIHQVLTRAGFEAVNPVLVRADQVWGRDAEDAAGFLGDWGPLHFLLGQVDQRAATRARTALATALRPYEQPDAVRLRATAWLVTAVRA
jgi:SAM-dependent methyltransferase